MSEDKLSREEQVEARKGWLAEPFMTMFDDNTFRIRRNLLAISVIAFVYKCAATGIDPKSSFLGIKLIGLKSGSVDIILALGVFYFLLHFLWSGWDKFQEWQLRLTGMKVAKPSHGFAFSDGIQAGADDQEQATLSAWWVGNIKQIDELKVLIENKEKLVTVDNTSDLANTINVIRSNQDKLIDRSVHIEASLLRYEKGFDNLQSSQKYRWVLLEFLFPILLSFSALILLSV